MDDEGAKEGLRLVSRRDVLTFEDDDPLLDIPA
jgi:hypothetical protein